MAEQSSLDALLEALPELDVAALEGADEEEVFDRATFELVQQIGIRVAALAGAQLVDEDGRRRPWRRNEAILCGLLVRLAKMMTAFVGHLAAHEAEPALQLSRSISETTVNLRYLIGFESPELSDRFVAHSFVNDKRLRSIIDRNVSERGEALLIEERMIESMERRLSQVGLILDDVPAKPSPDWAQNLRFRMEQLDGEDAYMGMFGNLSAYTHGSWHELVIYHLDQVDGGYEPDLAWSDTRPQLGISIAMMASIAASVYSGRMIDDEATAKRVQAVFDQGNDQALRLHELHESYIVRTGGPELSF